MFLNIGFYLRGKASLFKTNPNKLYKAMCLCGLKKNNNHEKSTNIT